MISNTDLKGVAALAPIVAGVGARCTALKFDLAHHLPGRLRLRSDALKGNAQAIEEARQHLAQMSGVTATSANPITGSVLLEYDPEIISPSKVSDVLAGHGYILGVIEVDAEAGGGWADKLAIAVTDWVIDALVKRLALTMISALA